MVPQGRPWRAGRLEGGRARGCSEHKSIGWRGYGTANVGVSGDCEARAGEGAKRELRQEKLCTL